MSTTRFEFEGTQLTNLEYALCAEEMGKIGWASECFNCSAPDTGNMEVFHRYGTLEQKERWLKPLMNGEIRSAFLMTEPAVASSDATNIETSKWSVTATITSSTAANGGRAGVGDPALQDRDRDGQDQPRRLAPFSQQSQVLVPLDTPGVTIERMLSVYGYDHAPHGHGQVLLKDVRVPVENVLLGEGRGLRDRAGPARAGPHPPLHAHHRRCRDRDRGDDQAAAVAGRVRQDAVEPFGVGGAAGQAPASTSR